MSYHERLTAEINATLDDLISRGEAWRAGWVAHAICSDHSSGLAGNDDADFWQWCTYQEVRDQVRRTINARAGDKPETNADDRQLRLPGYQFLQAYYVVRRDEEDIGVPIHDLTDEEVEAKAKQYRAMGAACFGHADDLDRFRSLRRVAVAE